MSCRGERGRPWAVLSWGVSAGGEGPGSDADPHPDAQRATHRHWTYRPTALIAFLPRFVPLSRDTPVAGRVPGRPDLGEWDEVGPSRI
jgi:hypothetical protein